MSRVGMNPVRVPDGVVVAIANDVLTAKGKLGEESVKITKVVEVAIRDGEVRVLPRGTSKEARTMWGTTRSLVQNAVSGVSEGFTKRLNVIGVGYRAQIQGSVLNLQLGYSHDIQFPVPDGIKITLEGDRGGVIASLVGTHTVLSDEDSAMIRGFLINKFRGDVRLFDEGLRDIERRTGWPGMGVMPWLAEKKSPAVIRPGFWLR